MNENMIAQVIEEACSGDGLLFQVIQDSSYLYVYINRTRDAQSDYEMLAQKIRAAIASLSISSLEGVWLYSRAIESIDPDWEMFLEFASPIAREKPGDAVEANTPETSEIDSADASQTDFNISKYCFTRNKSLLTSELLPPSPKLAELLTFFHALPDGDKQPILTVLENFFRTFEPPAIESFHAEIQDWLEKLTQFDESDARKAGIWLSRYCFDSEKTMSEVQAVLDFEALKAAAKQEASQEAANIPAITETTEIKANVSSSRRSQTSRSATSSKHWSSLAFPIGWAIATLMVIVLGIVSANPTQAVEKICQNATGSKEYCELAVKIVGATTLQSQVNDAIPMTDKAKGDSFEFCREIAYHNLKKTDPKTSLAQFEPTPAEVFPGIYLLDLQQKNLEPEQTGSRTACVFKNTQKRLLYLYADAIPFNWPLQPYEGKSAHESINQTLGIYNVFILLGAGTLFTAIGMLIAAMFNLGIRVDSLEELYKAAFILGLIDAIVGAIPVLGWMISIPLATLLLGLTSAFVKGFHVKWSDGYRVVALGAVAVIGTRAILCWTLFALIASVVF
jgi:uncharacterized membrane protein YvlD (DUF360 family)